MHPGSMSDCPIERLLRLAEIDTDDGRWLRRALNRLIADGTPIVDGHALHLYRLQRRDEWLRLAGDYTGGEGWRKAAALAIAIHKFETRQRPRWELAGGPPETCTDVDACLWHASRWGRLPKVDQLYRILT